MANRAIGKILRFERIYNIRKDAKSTLAMALSYYMGYAVSGQRDLLHKANFVLQTADFSADLGLAFARCFIASEMENFEYLEELLVSLKSRRNAMKSHEPVYYAYYLYFSCLHALSKGKERSASKQYRALTDYYQQLEVVDARLLLANLNLIMGEYETAFSYLHKAYKSGENSPLFFVCLVRAFGESKPSNTEAELLLPLILWALNSGCFIDNIIVKNEMLAESLLRRRPKVAEALHEYHPANWTLHIIVTARMIGNDLSSTALNFYREAEARQLQFPQLYDFLLRAAHRNENEEISGYALAQYIKQEGEIPEDLRPFVYHLIAQGVLGGRHDEIMKEIGGDIWAFACQSLKGHLYGKYYYSLYKFMVNTRITGKHLPVEQKYILAAEEVIKSLLFAYDVEVCNPRVKRILVQEDFKRQEKLQSLKDGRVRVNLWSPNVKITCFDENLRNIVDSKHSLTKLVQNASFEMYQWFYKQNHQPLEMLFFLADHHIKSEHLTREAIEIFDKVLKIGGLDIDREFVKMINATLGGYYAKEGDFVRAQAYFEGLDINTVNRKYLEQILSTFLHTHKHDLVANLLASRGEDISDKVLFPALKRISASIEKIANKKGVASTAADMLMKGWHDEVLMNMVLKHYVAPLSAWVELAKTLSNLGIFKLELFIKILETAMLTRDCGKGVQSIFMELAKQSPKNDILQDFVMYICYEIIISDLKPESSTIQILEGFVTNDSPDMLFFALAHVYISDGINRPKSREILISAIVLAQEADIIFPIFKEIKDKQIISAYIDRNAAFMHRSRGEYAVTLHHRTTEDEEFTQTPMIYVAFGIWLAHIPHFYGEEIEYFFAEARGSGSVKTAPKIITNNTPHLLEKIEDLFYTINSALVYEQMFKYEKVEEIVTARLAEKPEIRAKIM